MTKPKIYTMSIAKVYPLYVKKAEKKGRTKEEVDQIIRWLTGYGQDELEAHLANETDLETFFQEAPQLNPSRKLITGVICGVRVETIEDPIMQEIRYQYNVAAGGGQRLCAERNVQIPQLSVFWWFGDSSGYVGKSGGTHL